MSLFSVARLCNRNDEPYFIVTAKPSRDPYRPVLATHILNLSDITEWYDSFDWSYMDALLENKAFEIKLSKEDEEKGQILGVPPMFVHSQGYESFLHSDRVRQQETLTRRSTRKETDKALVIAIFPFCMNEPIVSWQDSEDHIASERYSPAVKPNYRLHNERNADYYKRRSAESWYGKLLQKLSAGELPLPPPPPTPLSSRPRTMTGSSTTRPRKEQTMSPLKIPARGRSRVKQAFREEEEAEELEEELGQFAQQRGRSRSPSPVKTRGRSRSRSSDSFQIYETVGSPVLSPRGAGTSSEGFRDDVSPLPPPRSPSPETPPHRGRSPSPLPPSPLPPPVVQQPRKSKSSTTQRRPAVNREELRSSKYSRGTGGRGPSKSTSTTTTTSRHPLVLPPSSQPSQLPQHQSPQGFPQGFPQGLTAETLLQLFGQQLPKPASITEVPSLELPRRQSQQPTAPPAQPQRQQPQSQPQPPQARRERGPPPIKRRWVNMTNADLDAIPIEEICKEMDRAYKAGDNGILEKIETYLIANSDKPNRQCGRMQ